MPVSPRSLSLKWGLLPLGLYLLLAIGAACIVPCDYTGNPRPTPPDEGPHTGYIEHLLHQHTLPVFRSLQDNYEGHQPPLFYLSSVPAYMLGELLNPSPHEFTRPGIVVVRIWAALMAGIGVWIAWLLGRRVFGPDKLLSLAPALFLALWPGRTMIVSAVTNDSLADSLCLLTFYLSVIILSDGLSRRRVVLLGLAWALALMSKSTSLSLGPVVLLAVVMRAVADDPEHQTAALERAVTHLLLAAVPVVVLAGWWFVRNQMLYGDPLAAKVFADVFSKDRATPDYFFKLGLSGGAYFTLVVVNTALSFWGVFGQANVYQPAGYYLAGFTVWLGALAGLVAQKARDSRGAPVMPVAPSPAATKRGKRAGGTPAAREVATQRKGGAPAPAEVSDWRRQMWFLAWLLFATVVAFFLRFNTTFYQAQARYLLAASGPIALLLTLGLWNLHRARYGQWAVALALGIMLVMSLSSVFGFTALAAAHNPPPFFGG